MEFALVGAALLVALALGIPIYVVLGLLAVVMFWLEGTPLIAVAQIYVDHLNSITLLAIPFFIVSATFMQKGGIAQALCLDHAGQHFFGQRVAMGRHLQRLAGGLLLVVERLIKTEQRGRTPQDGSGTFRHRIAHILARDGAAEDTRLRGCGENRIVHSEIRPTARLPLQSGL